MQLDVMPTELGIIPDIGASSTGPSASGIKLGAQATRDPKSRKSTKPLLMTLCDIANYVLQDICGQQDMEFSFEGLQDDEDKAAVTTLGVQGRSRTASYSIDEVRDRLDLPPWGLQETSEPVVFTAQGPIPFSMAPQLIANMQGAGASGQGTNSGQRTAFVAVPDEPAERPPRRADEAERQSHPAPVAAAPGAPVTPAPLRRRRGDPVTDAAHRGHDFPLERRRVPQEGCRVRAGRAEAAPAEGPADLHVGRGAHPGAGAGDDRGGHRQGRAARRRCRARRGHLPGG